MPDSRAADFGRPADEASATIVCRLDLEIFKRAGLVIAIEDARAGFSNPATRVSARAELGGRLLASPFLSGEERTALSAALAPPVMAKAQGDLIREGASADSLLVVTEGWACRYSMTQGGGRQLAALLVPGDVCNVDSLVFERLDYGVLALTTVHVAALPRQRAVALANKYPGVARAFTWIAALDNLVLSKWAVSLGRRSATERLAHLLCELSVRLDSERNDSSSYGFPLTQEQIADTLGLTSVHVNRTMRQLREDGLIALEGRIMILPDVARIRRVAGFDQDYLHAAAVS